MSERALLFTDVVDSTRTIEQLGADRAAALWLEHDRRARTLLARYGGIEAGRGDGFFLLFDSAADAAGYALGYHSLLAEIGLTARCGLHYGSVQLRENAQDEVVRGAPGLEVMGLATSIAARIMSLAGGGRTLLSAAAINALGDHRPGGDVEIRSRGHYRLKGIEAPVEVFELGRLGALAFDPPTDTEKAYRVARVRDLWLPVREVPHNLPAERDAFVGRASELEALAGRLDTGVRLTTVVGPGGTGKTRFVTRFAWMQLGDWPGGIYFCDLSEARSVEGIGAAVASGLGLRLDASEPQVQLAHSIADCGRCLLILDNFEQVVEHAPATVGAWLDRAEAAAFVVTSRERLHVAGEEVFALEPLPPESDGVELFGLRARAQRPGFEVDEANRPAIEQIVRLLDGLPLAIELAAARVPLLGVAGVRDRLHERFRLLAGGLRAGPRRQQTLQQALDWSHGLLDEAERAVFRRAGVFAGSFSLAAAQQVLAGETLDDWAVLDHLGALVDKSLVVADAGEPPRYRLLETLRAYALAKLDEAGENEATRRRHAQAVRAELEREFAQGWDVPYNELHERWQPDFDNVRAAMDWAHVAGEAELEIAMAGASPRMWLDGGNVVEGRRRVEQAVRRIDRTTPPAMEARLLLAWWLLSLPATAEAQYRGVERAVALYRDVGDPLRLAEALIRLVQAAEMRGDLDAVELALQEAESLCNPGWPLSLRWRLLGAQAMRAYAYGHFAEASVLAEKELAIARAGGDHLLINTSMELLQDLASAQGNFDEAVARAGEMVASMRRQRFPGHIGQAIGKLAIALEGAGRLDEALAAAREATEHLVLQERVWAWLDDFALLASRRGRMEAAAHALGRADATRLLHETPRDDDGRQQRDELLDRLRQALGEAELRRLLAQGAALSDEEAARRALSD